MQGLECPPMGRAASVAVALIMVWMGGCERSVDDSPIELGPFPPDTPESRAQGERPVPYPADRFSIVVTPKNAPDRPTGKWRSVGVYIQLSELVTGPKQVAFFVGEPEAPMTFSKIRSEDNWFVTIDAEILERDGGHMLELRFLSQEGPRRVPSEITDPIIFPIPDDSEITDLIEFPDHWEAGYEIGKPVVLATVLKDGRKQPVNLYVADLPQEDGQ